MTLAVGKRCGRCYDFPLILGELMRRFAERADRGQWALLPECLDDFVDEARNRSQIANLRWTDRKSIYGLEFFAELTSV
jgi:hypothetical protein